MIVLRIWPKNKELIRLFDSILLDLVNIPWVVTAKYDAHVLLFFALDCDSSPLIYLTMFNILPSNINKSLPKDKKKFVLLLIL